MFKWVVCLCATLYFTLLIYGAPPEGEDQVAAVETETEAAQRPVVEPEPSVTDVAVAADPKPEDVVTAATEIIPAVVTESLDPAPAADQTQSIADIAKTLKPTRTAAPQVELASATPEPAPEPSNGVGEIWRVTGSAVNLRAGASTQFAVLGRTTRGDSAEVMELLDNGWAKVYVLENGIEAYMSADFLAREAQ